MTSCIVVGSGDGAQLLRGIVADAGFGTAAVIDRVDMTRLGASSPELVVIDSDRLEGDVFEAIRMTRFVVPDATIAVYTPPRDRGWVAACHRAGANCLVSKHSPPRRIAEALRRGADDGCYTDPAVRA